FELGLGENELRDLELGTLLHDVGKINISDEILRKPERLDAMEWDAMKRHPIFGHEMLTGVSFLEGAARIVAEHHESWDGLGYPCGLQGDGLRMGARLRAGVRAFDALISAGVY